MNPKLIGKILGAALILEAALMTVPLICAFCYNESASDFLIPMAVAAAAGGALLKCSDSDKDIVSREGFISTGITWIGLSVVGLLPFTISGAIANPVDALFETVSGFTTTGATILTDIESLPRSIRMWRCFLHWIGGMGILVFMSAIMHFARGSQINLVKAESTGPIVSKLLPKAGSTAKVLYGIYTLMSALLLTALLLLGMPLFDAICLTFSAAGTGGFGVLNDNCASYTVAQQIALNAGTIMFGVSFSVYFLMLIGKIRTALDNEELRLYFKIIIAATLLIFADLLIQGNGYSANPLMALHYAAFNTGTIITTTGFAIGDSGNWPRFAQCVLLLLTICGACAGSTGGGLKVSRVIIMAKAFGREMAIHLRPEQVKKVHIDHRPLDDNIVRNTGTYCFLCCLILAFSILLVSVDNKGFDTTITAVLTCFNNVGPGFGEVSNMNNYSGLSGFSKLILSADMLIGRLEIYPILALFRPSTWRKF